MLTKIILISSSKKVHCLQNCVRFHAMESEIEISQKFWKKRNSSAFYWSLCTHIVSLLYLMVRTLFIHFYAILFTKNRDNGSQKFQKKCHNSSTCWAIFTKKWKTSIYVRIKLNIKFQEILCISSRATLATNFFCLTHRHFSEKIKSCSSYSKMCKSIKKNGSQKFSRNQCFLQFI